MKLKTLVEYTVPMVAGFLIMFLVLPQYGGQLDVLVQKVAIDWELPLVAVRVIGAVALALILSIIFGLLMKVAIWVAVVFVLVAIFAPAMLKDVKIVPEEIVEKVQEIDFSKWPQKGV